MDGTPGPDSVFIEAIDANGVVLSVYGPRGPQQPDPHYVSLLTYLDFGTGTYTTLDDTVYASDTVAAMDADYLVWTHDHQAFYLDRSNLSAAPQSAAPGARGILRVAIVADELSYTTITPDDDSDFGQHVNTIYTGRVGSSGFAAVTSPFCSTVGMTAIDNGDFLALAGTNSADYGLYRVVPGQSTLGAPVVLFGLYPRYNGPDPNWRAPDDFCGVGATTAAVIDNHHTWTILGGRSAPKQFGAAGDIAAPTDDSGGRLISVCFAPRPVPGSPGRRHDDRRPMGSRG